MSLPPHRMESRCCHSPEAVIDTVPAISRGVAIDMRDLPATLADVLRRCVERHGQTHLIHIGPDGTESRQTYAALWDEAVRIAGGLLERQKAVARPILLQLDDSRDFFTAFWGAVLGGFVPVPAAVPATSDPASHSVVKFRKLWQILEKPLVLTYERLAPLVDAALPAEGRPAVPLACLETLRQGKPVDTPHANAGDVALMMLTSGSTGVSKAAMLTHRNLVMRSAAAQQMNRCCSDEPTLNWMPLDHVVGLVMSHLQDVFVGCEQIHVATPYVLQDPLRWLDLMDRYRVAITFAPNFAYGLVNDCGRDIARRRWDLACVRCILNGGEAIVPRTARRFLQLLAPHGLRGNAMRPVWGMSETCSAVTFSERFSADNTGEDDALVDLGLPIAGIELRIVDEQDQVLREGMIGRLQCRGDPVMCGYWRNPELTKAAFTPDGWFETGDRGFLRVGRLTLSGRDKDIIIVNGLNYHSHDIEAAVEEIEGVAPSFTAACAVRGPNDEREEAAIFFVCRDGDGSDPASLARTIRSQVLKRIGINPHYVLSVSHADIPKTQIGKIQRARLRARFEAGDFESALQASSARRAETHAAPRTRLEHQLALLWAEVLGLATVGVDEDFFELGGHSLLAMRLIARAGELLHCDLPLALLFESPTIRRLAERIGTLAAGTAGAMPDAMRPLERAPGDSCRASFAQERLWFLNRLAPESPVYNVPIALRLLGLLDADLLERALTAIIIRHAALRTTFRDVDGQAMQVVGAPRPVGLERVDLPPAACENRAELAAVLRREARRPFDLSADPMLRATLYRFSASDHLLLIVVHHVAFDDWSKGIFIRELGRLYSSFAAGDAGREVTPSPLVQYPDYALWQRQWIDGAMRQAQVAFWRDYLADAPPVLNLPLDRVRPAVRTHAGALLQRQLPDGISHTVATLGRQEQATPFMTWLAAVYALLYRYTGQQDITIGTPVAGRTRMEIEPVIGFFANTIPLRTDVSDAPTFRELIQRVRKATLAAYVHADLPFEQIVAAVHPGRDASGSALFQVMLTVEEAHSDLELPGVRDEPFDLHLGTAMFDLTLTIGNRRGITHVFAEYSTDLFEADTIGRMLASFHRLLVAALEYPDRPTGELPLLSESERHQLLVEWNDTGAACSDRCVHHLFEDQVARTPDAVAVMFDDRQLTYAALNARANQLAHRLMAAGVGPEVLVGICMQRSVEMIAGVLGILKAGGAYVPLDPAYPRERLAFMVEDAQPPILLTQQTLASRLPEHPGRTLCVDSELPADSGERSEDPPRQAGPDNLAYVLYTSGSTGQPKGVAIEHRSAATFLNWVPTVFSDSELAGTLFSTSLCFDLSIFELFAPLSRGGAVILAENALQLPELPAARRVTLINTVPSAMAELVRLGGVPTSVRTINLAGEPLAGSLARSVYELDHVEKLYNLFGPTEDTTYSTCAFVGRGDSEAPSIGRPIAGTRVYVLDRHRNPLPVGVQGELYIGGAGLARGYYNRPQLTAERFVADPFTTQSGARLYRTGDLARYRRDSNLEFLGRIDDQVKIRGFRIEPGEIEAVLAEHPSLRQVLVLAREDTTGDKQLVAYVVPADASFADTQPLRAFLRERLPDYMLPAAYVVLERLPLTPNGKVDRRALPPPQYGREGAGVAFVAARDSLEELVSGVWRDVLQLDRVSVHDSFFELGGHSLLAVQVVSRLGKLLNIELPLRRMFDAPTVAAIAADVARLRAGAGETALERILQEVEALTDEEASLQLGENTRSALDAIDSHATTSEKSPPSTFPVGGRTLWDLVFRRAVQLPAAVAIAAPARRALCFGDLERHITVTAIKLNAMGVGRASRVAVALPNGPEMASAFLAVASCAICVPLDLDNTAEEFEFFLDHLQAHALIVAAGCDSSAPAVAHRLGIRVIEIDVQPNAPAGLFTLSCAQEGSNGRAPDLARADDVALVLHTSGTTARPKQVALTHANLCASACHIATALQLTAEDRCLNVMPLYHVHGLAAAVLASLAAGGSVACTPGIGAGSFFECMDSLRPTWYTAVPSMHQAILAAANAGRDAIRRNPLRFIRSASAALPPSLAAALESCFAAPVIEAYGMTEASHQIASNPLPPRLRKRGSVGVAAGPEVAVMDDTARLLPAGERGEIVVRGDNVTQGYLNNPEANAEAFTAGWLRTGDQGYIDSEGYVFLTGRLKEIINRGGEKVSPREVEDALLEHPAVSQAVVFRVPHETLGDDVAAAVVLTNEARSTAAEIRASLFGRLAQSKIPSQLAIVERIPTGATGKIERNRLAVQMTGRLKPDFVAPRDSTEITVAAIFSEVLGIRDVGVDDNFFALGGDSLRGFQALARIRAQLQVNLTIVQLFKEPTAAQIAREVERVRKVVTAVSLERILGEVERLSDAEAAGSLQDESGGQ